MDYDKQEMAFCYRSVIVHPHPNLALRDELRKSPYITQHNTEYLSWWDYWDHVQNQIPPVRSMMYFSGHFEWKI